MLLAAPVIETNLLGLCFPMVVQSSAAEHRLAPALIRALEAAQDAGVSLTSIDDLRRAAAGTPAR